MQGRGEIGTQKTSHSDRRRHESTDDVEPPPSSQPVLTIESVVDSGLQETRDGLTDETREMPDCETFR